MSKLSEDLRRYQREESKHPGELLRLAKILKFVSPSKPILGNEFKKILREEGYIHKDEIFKLIPKEKKFDSQAKTPKESDHNVAIYNRAIKDTRKNMMRMTR